MRQLLPILKKQKIFPRKVKKIKTLDYFSLINIFASKFIQLYLIDTK